MSSSARGVLLLFRKCVDCGFDPRELCDTRPIIYSGEDFRKALAALAKKTAKHSTDPSPAVTRAVQEWWAASPPHGFCELRYDEEATTGVVHTGHDMGILGDWAGLFVRLAEEGSVNFHDVSPVTHIVSLLPRL